MRFPLELEVRRSLKAGYLVHGGPMDKLVPELKTGLKVGGEVDRASRTPDAVCFAILQQLGDPIRSLRMAQIYTSQNQRPGDKLLAVIVDPKLVDGLQVSFEAVGSDMINLASAPAELCLKYGYNAENNTVFGIPINTNLQSYVHPDEVRAKRKGTLKGPLILPSAMKAVGINMEDASYFRHFLVAYPDLHSYRWPVIAIDGRLISTDLNPKNFSIPSEG